MGIRIVVIEDDIDTANMVTSLLRGEGYTVYTGYDGQMGMEMVKQHRPQLIVSDYNMPFFHGGRVLEFIRRTPELKEIPLVFLSGAPGTTIYPMLDANSRVSFLKKPLDVEELLSLVKHMLEQYPQAA